MIPNGKFTIISGQTGNHRTFRVHTILSEGPMRGRRVVSLMIGSDNQADYEGFGFIRQGEDGTDSIQVWKRYKGDGCKHGVYAQMLCELLQYPEIGKWSNMGYAVLVSRHCMRCNRELTTPESIRLGIGPECASKGDL